MAKPIKIKILGTDHQGIDAPGVEDLLAQIQDFVFVLTGVEKNLKIEGKEILWRLTDVSRNSPYIFEITPFPKKPENNIDHFVDSVVRYTAMGMNNLATKGERPDKFTDDVIQKTEKIYQRVTNGLAETEVDFSYFDIPEKLLVSKDNAKKLVESINHIREISYRELGSLEGYIIKVELDSNQRPIVSLKSRLDGKMVRCVSSKETLDRIGDYRVKEVLSRMRVRVHGIIIYKSPGLISKIEVDKFEEFKPDQELPDTNEIVFPDFTKGVESSTFLKELRKDE